MGGFFSKKSKSYCGVTFDRKQYFDSADEFVGDEHNRVRSSSVFSVSLEIFSTDPKTQHDDIHTIDEEEIGVVEDSRVEFSQS